MKVEKLEKSIKTKRFGDDTMILAESKYNVESILYRTERIQKMKYSVKMNKGKTKMIVVNKSEQKSLIIKKGLEII